MTQERGPESVKEILKRIPEISESAREQLTTQKQPRENLNPKDKKGWLKKWLRMQVNHPQLQELEKEVYEFCSGYAKCPWRGYRLIIYGNNGVGKSHAARAIHSWANRMAINLPLVNAEVGVRLATSAFYNWPSIVDRLKSGEWELLEEMKDLNLLVLDDIGAEHDPSKMGAEKLYLILERREFKWTVLTTNVGQLDWEYKFEKRIASRLFRNFRHVAVDEVPDFKA